MNLVLGSAWGMDVQALWPFIVSCRQTIGLRNLVLCVREMDPVTRGFLAGVGVKLVTIGDAEPLRNVQINSLRYVIYQQFVRGLPSDIDRLLITDVRDVVFQSDPFDAIDADGLHCFLEDGRKTLAACDFNANWLTAAYGTEALNQLGHLPIACSGTTLGDRGAIQEYLDAMVAGLYEVSDRIPGITQRLHPVDQAVHNHVVRRGLPAEPTFHSNETGPVLTLYHVPSEEVELDEEQRVLNAAGTAPSVVHQYDRHPLLVDWARARYGTPRVTT